MKRITNFFNASETRLPRGNAPPTPPLAPDGQATSTPPPALDLRTPRTPLSVNTSSVASRHTLAPPDMGYGDTLTPTVSGNGAPYLYPLPPSPGMLPSRPGTSSGFSGYGSRPVTPHGSNFNLSSVNLSTTPLEVITARKSRDTRFDKLGSGLAWRLARGNTQDLESYDCGPLLRGERVCWSALCFFQWAGWLAVWVCLGLAWLVSDHPSCDVERWILAERKQVC